jgi:hypothetical protein
LSSFPDAVEWRQGELVSGEQSIGSESREDQSLSQAPDAAIGPSLGEGSSHGISSEGSGQDSQAPQRPHQAAREPSVSITLSRNQVDHVIRAALGDDAVPSVSSRVAGTGFHGHHARQMLSARYRVLQDNRRLSRSLLAGLLVLSCFPAEGVDMGIKDISEQLDLNTSTVHRYVLTLVAAGLLERDPETRRYRLLPE